MAADSKTIDQLPTKDTLNNGDFIPVDDGEQTYKVLFSTIIASVPGVTGIALSQDGQSIVVTIRGQQNPVTITTHDNTKQNVLSFDNEPTQSSANPVKSGGVYAAALGGNAQKNADMAVQRGARRRGFYMARADFLRGGAEAGTG